MDTLIEEVKKIPKKKLISLIHKPDRIAAAVNLVYVQDSQQGITRVKKGKHFDYLLNESKLTDPNELARIKDLVIPPAWQNVWICVFSNGHL